LRMVRHGVDVVLAGREDGRRSVTDNEHKVSL
jgi:hypothetical protein